MFGFDKINLTLSFSPFFFVLGVLLIAGYAFYVYRYTVPLVSPSKKLLLTGLRTLALILVLLIIFEPILILTKKLIIEPVNLLFVDNSRSIRIKDGTEREIAVKNFLNDFSSSGIENNSESYSFGNKVERREDFDSINFTENSTNFSSVFTDIDKSGKNISSVIIVSDGVITDGSNPSYTAERLNIPAFTVGIGDTTRRNDIEIRNVIFNEYIYAENPTTISAAVLNKGFEGKTVQVSLFEGNTVIETKQAALSNDGIQNVEFTYTPHTGGEKKMSVSVQPLQGEFTGANNRKIFYVNVLSNKIKTLILAGAPSADVSFIRNTLEADKNLTVNSITVVAPNKFLENNNREKLIDSADIFYLVGFPSKETPDDLIRKVLNRISSASKPYFLILSDGIDFAKLTLLRNELPFTFSGRSNGFFEVQPLIVPGNDKNPLLQSSAPDPVQVWNDLPPIYQPNADFSAKPESEVLSRVKINNVQLENPLIVTRRIGAKRSIAILAKDVWKWKLQTANKNLNVFDSFVSGSLKWLNTSEEQKQVTIKTSKKIYSLGEDVEFIAQVYDESFNPVNDAEVSLRINYKGENTELGLSLAGNGIYEGTFQSGKPGDYSFSGSAQLDGKSLGKDNGTFNIGEVDIEMVDTRMNDVFLKGLSNQSGGRFYYYNDYSGLFNTIKQLNVSASKEKIETSEISLWSSEWLLVIVVLIFSLEWFIRKRSGML